MNTLILAFFILFGLFVFVCFWTFVQINRTDEQLENLKYLIDQGLPYQESLKRLREIKPFTYSQDIEYIKINQLIVRKNNETFAVDA